VQSKEQIAKGKLDGRWSLVYSTRIDKNAYSSSSSSSDFVDLLTGNLYKLFFRFAPFLAGSSGSSNSDVDVDQKPKANRAAKEEEEEEEKEASAPFIAANEQIIDLQAQSIINTVRIRIKGIESRPVVITVKGLVKIKEEEEEGEKEEKKMAERRSSSSNNKSGRSSSSTMLDVIFTSFDVNGFTLPLPRPKGTLTTTYIDEDLRVGRGGRGGVFIVKRF